MEISAYRDALRAFLATPEAQGWRGVHRHDVAEEMRLHADLVGLLYDRGFSRYGYPETYGGLGGDVRYWAVLYDELARAELPIPEQFALMSTLVAPTIRFAPELAAQYLPDFLSGREWWGQGFSEPEAGSDLAALRCRATAVEGGWRVSGQKLWTSHGETATRIVLLARTGTQESRHRGLSMLLVDVDTPGLSVRPVRLANGRAELAECFFDEAFVPSNRIIGVEGEGWAVAMYLLQYERAVYAWMRSCWLLQRLKALVGQVRPGQRAEQLLGETYLDVVSLRARSASTVERLARGETVGPEASADKVLLGTAEQCVHEAARRLLEADFALGGGEEPGAWRSEWWYSRMTTVYGGCAEVQRGILADHVLALPKA